MLPYLLQSLVGTDTNAVFGFAAWAALEGGLGVCVDVYCHPSACGEAESLLGLLPVSPNLQHLRYDLKCVCARADARVRSREDLVVYASPRHDLRFGSMFGGGEARDPADLRLGCAHARWAVVH